ncbi:hypothetical protein CNMCM6936_009025 [Aspergillus lentulus]|uniref:Uncharacterized protein n=1 Tax=Aspergillus lentulus TaxID=293939 RepID=A0AAN6BLP8_ASPLE|nr:hypothetical protein CNMCM6069_007968 [Aspergillus lentulus]KAF4164531.1 hypothetical protein CNMCM6936_009025 [Aspergillus lentulus]KAF4185740.1 hypothetical protein CNMCM7927_006298 [Aspergillus lentulus]KAF4201075.1 hypothetical protein CNMCM8927_002058 [Aspergillus lentulus]
MFGIATPKRPRPESESEEEGPYRPRRHGKVEASLGSQNERDELITGVDAADLPIAGDNPNKAQRKYQKLPAIRILDWQIDGDGQPIRKPLRDSTALTAALIQTRGTEMIDPCSFCKDNKGTWRMCVVEPNPDENSKLAGACANCRFSRRHNCDLRAPKDDESIDSSLSSRDFLTDTTYSSVAEEVQKDEGQAAPIQEDTQTNVQEQVKESDSQTPAPRSRLDGKVVPFPLGPDTINDLPLLKQAIKDIVAHLNILHRRVQQLEEKRQSINPWELV